jgi:quinol monooxygenase YgiN
MTKMQTVIAGIGVSVAFGLAAGRGGTVVAQAPADATAYAVAYVEVMPAATQAMTTALARYREASRTEAGFTAIESFEQVGRPGHFTIVETWRDQAALDAHAKTAPLQTFQATLAPIRVSGYDQRPYKALTVAPPQGAATADAVVVISHIDIGGPFPNAPAMIRAFAEASRRETGNLRYDVLQHAMRANHYTVVEVWRNQQALDAHAAAAGSRAYRDALQPMTGSPLDERVYRGR